MRNLSVGILVCLLSTLAFGEQLDYSIYSIPLFRGNAELLAETTRVYTHDDIEVVVGPGTRDPNWTKSLNLSKGFQIGASVYREHRVDGFGMWIKKNDGGFSWEWFARDGATLFRKLQGPGVIRVRFHQSQDLEEISEIEFLTDVTMRLNTRWFIPFLDRDSDLIVVKKGSVLWLGP